MSALTTVREVLDFDVACYVSAARLTGRQHISREMRHRMAELYVDLQYAFLCQAPAISSREYRVLRLASLVLESEWKLAESSPAETPPPVAGVPYGPRGKRYQPYANVRLLNYVLGTQRHSSDASIERRCRETLRFLLRSWLSYEEGTFCGTIQWGCEDSPSTDEHRERLRRLGALLDQTSGWPQAGAPTAKPPCNWEDYVGPKHQANILEYLINLPQTRKHEENVFLRVIHLTEVTTSGILARIVGTRAWLENGQWQNAAFCLERAAELARMQMDIMLVLRRTMSVQQFLDFRPDTGNASAVQMTSAQTLHVHLLGVHPNKVEAIRSAQENLFLTHYMNEHFQPLRELLRGLPKTDQAERVLTAARDLDENLHRWRRVHLGMAHRYLPRNSAGSGGTSGAPYLSAFYDDRIFTTTGEFVPRSRSTVWHSQRLRTADRVRARPIFSPFN